MLEGRRNRMIVASLVVSSVLSFAFGSPLLPLDEVEGLKYVAETLGKRDLNVSRDSCAVESSVECNCTYLNDTVCHIIGIDFSWQSLAGKLPSQLFRLSYLETLDLSWNDLTGEIPREWGSTKLVNIILYGNWLTDSIPKEIGNITTLEQLNLQYNNLSGSLPSTLGTLVNLQLLNLGANHLSGSLPSTLGNLVNLQKLNLEANHLSGSLPSTLGNLVNLETLHLGSNNFTGKLPTSLGMLTSLTSIRISDNNFEGKIPSFIQNWINAERIDVQGSGLSGPLPSKIGLLTKLTNLRISDMNGDSSPFPPLKNVTSIKYLILRSCNIIGVLPTYLDRMEDLIILDLSFNKISGQIPPNFMFLERVKNIFLTGNLLDGSVPEWMLKTKNNIDLSYNKFKPLSNRCQSRNTNLFASSATDNNSTLVSCLDHKFCSDYLYRLHINCGGKEVSINGTKFEGDEGAGKPSVFVSSKTNWGFSNTGVFLYTTPFSTDYIEMNRSLEFPTPYSKLYENARVSPISLTYYAYCMGNGNYTISLHFAEIVFTNNSYFGSHGRRSFSVYVQGKLVVKDFNIVDAAGGILIPFIKRIPVAITNNTIEIRLYWAGKGTSILGSGGYGPLIAAISIESDFEPPSKARKLLPVGAILGIVAAIALAIVSILGILWWQGCLGRKNTVHQGK